MERALHKHNITYGNAINTIKKIYKVIENLKYFKYQIFQTLNIKVGSKIWNKTSKDVSSEKYL